jgi:hypothetical protein
VEIRKRLNSDNQSNRLILFSKWINFLLWFPHESKSQIDRGIKEKRWRRKIVKITWILHRTLEIEFLEFIKAN